RGSARRGSADRRWSARRGGRSCAPGSRAASAWDRNCTESRAREFLTMAHDHHHHPAGACGPSCDYGTFTRNAYWTGNLMLARDFVDEQGYVVNKFRHHNQHLHGSGVVCGLKVVPHETPACRDRFVCVTPGTAVDCCGHDIVVHDLDCLDLWTVPAIQALRD